MLVAAAADLADTVLVRIAVGTDRSPNMAV
jgi:hypothetical protein